MDRVELMKECYMKEKAANACQQLTDLTNKWTVEFEIQVFKYFFQDKECILKEIWEENFGEG